MKYDIIIAGSGLGGLECGVMLSKEGYNVCVLEKNPLIGGCLQTYKRPPYSLDTGIHYIGSLDEGQILNQYFRYMGIMDKLKLQRLDSDSFDLIEYDSRQFHYANGHDRFVERMSEQFPHERENLKRYVQELQKVGNFISIDQLKRGMIAESGMKYFFLSAHDFLSEITPDRKLQNVLASTSLLYGGEKKTSTFYLHGMINNSYIESAYRLVDGSMQIAERLTEVIRANGGTVLNNKEVTRFIVQGDQVIGVEVNRNEVFEATSYISNIHPRRTLELLDKSSVIKNAYISRVKSLPNTFGCFTLHLCMKKNSLPYQNRNIYLHAGDDVWYEEFGTDDVRHAMISFQRSSDTDSVDVVTILTPMHYSLLKQWEHTTVNNRGEDYLRFKERYTERILDLLDRKGYNFRPHIEQIYSTSPLSYRDYTGTADGSAYGIIKDYKAPYVGFISTKTKLKNFFFTGQNLNVHGALGVTLTAMYTCAEFLGEEYLAKKVAHA